MGRREAPPPHLAAALRTINDTNTGHHKSGITSVRRMLPRLGQMHESRELDSKPRQQGWPNSIAICPQLNLIEQPTPAV